MKTALKLIMGLLAGGLIGFLIGAFIVVAFTDTTWSEYVDKYYSIEMGEGLAVFLVALGSFIMSLLILVPIHELGHLVCGLLTGYKFVSFRIFNSEIDYINALEVSIPLMYYSRIIDEMRYDEALECLESLYAHKAEIMPLYVKEIACELAFLYLRTGPSDKAATLLDK